MSVRVDSSIYVRGKEPGSEAPRDLFIDPLPTEGGGVAIYTGQEGRVVEIADLRDALDRAERIQGEDGQ